MSRTEPLLEKMKELTEGLSEKDEKIESAINTVVKTIAKSEKVSISGVTFNFFSCTFCPQKFAKESSLHWHVLLTHKRNELSKADLTGVTNWPENDRKPLKRVIKDGVVQMAVPRTRAIRRQLEPQKLLMPLPDIRPVVSSWTPARWLKLPSTLKNPSIQSSFNAGSSTSKPVIKTTFTCKLCSFRTMYKDHFHRHIHQVHAHYHSHKQHEKLHRIAAAMDTTVATPSAQRTTTTASRSPYTPAMKRRPSDKSCRPASASGHRSLVQPKVSSTRMKAQRDEIRHFLDEQKEIEESNSARAMGSGISKEPKSSIGRTQFAAKQTLGGLLNEIAWKLSQAKPRQAKIAMLKIEDYLESLETQRQRDRDLMKVVEID